MVPVLRPALTAFSQSLPLSLRMNFSRVLHLLLLALLALLPLSQSRPGSEDGQVGYLVIVNMKKVTGFCNSQKESNYRLKLNMLTWSLL